MSKRDVFELFHQHGRLAQISLKSAYGFVQYHTTAEAQSAMNGLQGAEVKGRKISKLCLRIFVWARSNHCQTLRFRERRRRKRIVIIPRSGGTVVSVVIEVEEMETGTMDDVTSAEDGRRPQDATRATVDDRTPTTGTEVTTMGSTGSVRDHLTPADDTTLIDDGARAPTDVAVRSLQVTSLRFLADTVAKSLMCRFL